MKTLDNFIAEKLRLDKNITVEKLPEGSMMIDELIEHISDVGKVTISDNRKQVILGLINQRLINSIHDYIFVLDDDNIPSELYNQQRQYGKYLCNVKNSGAYKYMLFVNDELALNIEYNSPYKVQTLLIIYREQKTFEIYNIINK